MTQHMHTADRQYKLSTRQMTQALNGGIAYLMPWPAHILGEYGSGEYDGSPVTPEATDRVMDAYVMDALSQQMPGGRLVVEGGPALIVRGICAGRAPIDANLVPVIRVSIAPEHAIGARCSRETWAHEVDPAAQSLGRRGGAARAARMTSAQRSAAARQAVSARWARVAPVTDAQIESLRAEAGSAGDDVQVRICDRALYGSARARRECVRAIRAAQAQA